MVLIVKKSTWGGENGYGKNTIQSAEKTKKQVDDIDLSHRQSG